MTTSFSYQYEFTLDKAHFEECYDESVVVDMRPKRFLKAGLFVLFGIALLFSDLTRYAAYFFVGLGIVEALSIRYQRPWWLMRQMMSKAAGNDVTLLIDEHGIKTQSLYVHQLITWGEIYRIKETQAGFLVTHKAGTSYISKRCLNDDAADYIRQKSV